MSLKDTVTSACEALAITITGGLALSDAINLGGLRLFGLVMPSVWTTASLTFQASFDGGATWHNLKDADGNEVVAVANADDCLVWVPSAFAALPLIKIRSGTASAPVTQAADRSLTLILRGV